MSKLDSQLFLANLYLELNFRILFYSIRLQRGQDEINATKNEIENILNLIESLNPSLASPIKARRTLILKMIQIQKEKSYQLI